MEKRLCLLLLAVIPLLAPAACWAQDPASVTVAVSGLYERASTGDTFAYTGTVHQLWFPTADGRGWSVVQLLDAVAYQMDVGGRHEVSLAGFSQQVVTSAPGEKGTLPLAFWVYDGGPMPWFDGSLQVKYTAPPFWGVSPGL